MKALEILKLIYKDCKECEDRGFAVTFHTNVLNEAIKELEDLQNRSCEGCKHFAKYKDRDYGDCFGEARTLSDIDTVNKEFCCNKWELK